MKSENPIRTELKIRDIEETWGFAYSNCNHKFSLLIRVKNFEQFKWNTAEKFLTLINRENSKKSCSLTKE